MSDRQIHRHGLESVLASMPLVNDTDTGVTIRILSDYAHLNLRGDPANTNFVAEVTATLGQHLPVRANTMTTGDHQVFWLGPNEWLIMTPVSASLKLEEKLRESLSDMHASVTDLSGGQITLCLSGAHARHVLAKGCTLDLHPCRFKVEDCAQSGLAKANVLIGMIDERPIYEIIVRRSFAEYIAKWLKSAAREYGVTVSVN